MKSSGQAPQVRRSAALLRMTLIELCHLYYTDGETVVAIEIANRMSRITDGTHNPGKEVRVEGKCSQCGSLVELHETIRMKQLL